MYFGSDIHGRPVEVVHFDSVLEYSTRVMGMEVKVRNEGVIELGGKKYFVRLIIDEAGFEKLMIQPFITSGFLR